MNIKMLKAALVGLVLSVSGFANAGLITFDIKYDDTFGGGVESNIIGDGTLSYEGTLSNGEFLLSDLLNLSFFSNVNGVISELSDISVILSDVSLFIFENTGVTYATFTGPGNGALEGGNLEFSTGLAFEPGSNGAPCCGGTDISRLYIQNSVAGNYQMTLSTQVPEPSTLAIFALSILGLASRKLKKK